MTEILTLRPAITCAIRPDGTHEVKVRVTVQQSDTMCVTRLHTLTGPPEAQPAMLRRAHELLKESHDPA